MAETRWGSPSESADGRAAARRLPVGTARKTGPSGAWENASLHFHIPTGSLLATSLPERCRVAGYRVFGGIHPAMMQK